MKSILFVDDEVRILQGLKRLLRSMRNDWSMNFVASGAEALDFLRANEVDVVVSDMRMPGMMGDEFLKHVKEEYPHIVRLILSGHTEQAHAQRCLGVAHQFLSKPCDTTELRDSVERVCELSNSLKSVAHTKLAGSIGALPVAPRILVELQQAFAEPDVSFPQIAAIIEEDPSCASKILQVVNSSFFGLRREIQSVSDAARHLGLDTVRNLVLNEELRKSFERTVAKGYSLDAAQRHGFLASCIGPRLVRDHEVRETVRCASLVHDVGQSLFASRLPEEYERVLAKHKSGMGLHLAEREAFDTSHSELGGYLLGLWGLPTPIVEAVLFHHDPSRTGHREFEAAGAVHVACALAHEDESLLDMEYLRAVGVEENLDEWRAIANEKIAAVERGAAA